MTSLHHLQAINVREMRLTVVAGDVGATRLLRRKGLVPFVGRASPALKATSRRGRWVL